jgi:hypothetical protein
MYYLKAYCPYGITYEVWCRTLAESVEYLVRWLPESKRIEWREIEGR